MYLCVDGMEIEMNLLTFQQYDYQHSCQSLDDLEELKQKWGLFMHCFTNNDTDSYLMGWVELKTLHDNIERLYKILHSVVEEELNKHE